MVKLTGKLTAEEATKLQENKTPLFGLLIYLYFHQNIVLGYKKVSLFITYFINRFGETLPPLIKKEVFDMIDGVTDLVNLLVSLP